MLLNKRHFLKTSLSGALAAVSPRGVVSFARAASPATVIVEPYPTIKILRLTDDIVRERRWAFLIAALNCTVPAYGPYKIDPFTSSMTTQREIREVIAGSIINVVASDCFHPDLNANAIPIPIPIDRGLLGYRVALIRRNEQCRINEIHNISGLRQLTIGQGHDWGDVPIYQYNSIPLVTIGDYPLLFAMLSNGRFDIFPRGIVEIIPELEKFGAKYANIAIDNHLLIKYAYAEFFYVPKSMPTLAKRINDGLEIMLKDGSFEKLFQDRFSHALNELHLDRRVIISLDGPSLPPWISEIPKDLWLNPLKWHATP